MKTMLWSGPIVFYNGISFYLKVNVRQSLVDVLIGACPTRSVFIEKDGKETKVFLGELTSHN